MVSLSSLCVSIRRSLRMTPQSALRNLLPNRLLRRAMVDNAKASRNGVVPLQAGGGGSVDCSPSLEIVNKIKGIFPYRPGVSLALCGFGYLKSIA